MADHDDDNENVHNPIIVKCQKIKYKRLLELEISDDSELIAAGINMDEIELHRCIENIQTILTTKVFMNLDENLKLKILYVLSVLRGSNETIISLTDNKGKDGELVPILCISVFNIVWRRIMHPDNAEHKDDLVQMLLDKLGETTQIRETNHNDVILQIVFDAMETPEVYNPLKFTTVCPYGIVSNIIDTLSLLDVDEILAKPPTDLCELRNEAYLTAHRILCNLLDSEKMTEIYNKEEDELTDADATKLKKFETKARLRIKKQLSKDYENLVEKKKLQKIIRDIYHGCYL